MTIVLSVCRTACAPVGPFFWWGKEGKCVMHRDARAPCVGLAPVRLAVGFFRPLDNLLPDLPTKTLPGL